jgi:hypothetical protein
VLKDGRPHFARRLLFTSPCSLPGLPASQTPIFRVRTTLWRRPHGHAEELLGFFQRFPVRLARALAWRARILVAISERLRFFYLLVYTLDRREPEKRERAREVLRRVGGAGTAALPAQVLSDFWARG